MLASNLLSAAKRYEHYIFCFREIFVHDLGKMVNKELPERIISAI